MQNQQFLKTSTDRGIEVDRIDVEKYIFDGKGNNNGAETKNMLGALSFSLFHVLYPSGYFPTVD